MLDDVKNVWPDSSVSRRGFVFTSAFAAGFALTVQPIAAQTVISTDSTGLEAGMIEVPTSSGNIPGYRALPAQGGPFPVVLVLEEIFGLHEHIKDVCRRFAKLGYYAISVEYYSRLGDVSKLADIQQVLAIVTKTPDAQVMSDLDAAVAFAKASGKADTARLGVTGFCQGGRMTWLYAAHNPGLKAAVAWYGPIAAPTNDVRPKNPIDLVAEMKAPVLGLYGAADTGIKVEDVEKMKAAMAAANKPAEFMIYPEAPHGFNADYRASYREAAAKDGWQRLQAWFKKNGVA
ncbi:MAG: dienelactone hydrolase family protein [Proteobacteria bacterium]|nr:dienelactone hydrolase family protein [Pseudomonadota bacterium]MBI3496843.1 dienelactone hydrolase family protein [Pseudomonadota bacterium]